jgi:hypothetical protein
MKIDSRFLPLAVALLSVIGLVLAWAATALTRAEIQFHIPDRVLVQRNESLSADLKSGKILISPGSESQRVRAAVQTAYISTEHQTSMLREQLSRDLLLFRDLILLFALQLLLALTSFLPTSRWRRDNRPATASRSGNQATK